MREPRWRRTRRRIGGVVFREALDRLSRIGRYYPRSIPAHVGIQSLRNVPYVPETGGQRAPRAHRLDIYWRKSTAPRRLRPVVLYLHGGGFRILSKDTHWMMGLLFARAGYVVFNANYRLAPKHPYPAALEDSAAALAWVQAHAHRYGGDPRRVVIAGESAGANLALALAVSSSYQRSEPFARRVWDLPFRPAAAVISCGILQVSHSDRLLRPDLSPFLADRVREVERGYLRGYGDEEVDLGPHPSLADPLLQVEEREPDRPLPPLFTFAGTRDPLLEDSRRLKIATDRWGQANELRVYEAGLHAFHAIYWNRLAQACWNDQLRFLERVVGPEPIHTTRTRS